MKPYQQRVVEERDQLAEKQAKLVTFQLSPIYAKLSATEKHRLDRQAAVMNEYLSILEERIAAF